MEFAGPLKDFAKNSVRLVKRCTKPDAKGEFIIVRVRTLLYDAKSN